MGCSGSKASQATAPVAVKAGTPATAQGESASQIPEGDFKINFENVSGSEKLGAVAQFPETKYILIESVKEEGLIPSWNKGCENTPEMQVKAGDLIVVVNGVFGNSDLMIAELKSKAITLTVKRSQILEGDFKINLENPSGGESLGAVVEFPETKYILIESLKEEGLIPSWNKGCENTPETQVQAGDLIVVVNGVFGKSDLMLAELKSKVITLTVKRAQPVTGTPAAEAPAAEAPAAAITEVPVGAPAAGAPAAKAPSRAEATPTAAEAPAAESPAVEAPAADAAAAPVAGAPAEEALVAESPAAEAPLVEVPRAETPAAAKPAAVATAAAASKEPAVKSAAVVMPQVTVQAEDGDMSADAREERLCKLCMC
jgi:hypothetical protein